MTVTTEDGAHVGGDSPLRVIGRQPAAGRTAADGGVNVEYSVSKVVGRQIKMVLTEADGKERILFLYDMEPLITYRLGMEFVSGGFQG